MALLQFGIELAKLQERNASAGDTRNAGAHIDLLKAMLKNWHVAGNTKNGAVQLECEKGSLAMVTIFKNPSIGIVRCLAPAGTILGFHVHAVEREVICCESGNMTVTFGDGRVVEMAATDCLIVEPNVPHMTEYLTDTWSGAVLLPCASDIPDMVGKA